MKMKKIIFYMLGVVFVTACKKEAANPEFIDKPVIESYLRSGDTARLNVSRLVSYSADAQYSSDNLDALQIFISTNNTSYQMQPKGNGNYIASNPLLKITAGSTYNVSFTYNGKSVSATTVVPPKPTGYAESVSSISLPQITTTSGGFGGTQPTPITLTWTNNDGSYYLVVVENIEINPVLINTTETGPSRSFRNSPIQTNTFQIRSRQFHYFGWHRIILYHLNPDYANLYGNSSNNSNNLTNTETGITNGTGIFTGINADTLMLNVIKQ
jgi:hypothetical protein